MKKYLALLLLITFTTLTLAQKKEKIKGSKIVTIEQNEIGDFESLEISDNIEIYLDRGEKCELKIEADDNLHDIIYFDLNDKTLRIKTSKNAKKYKKLIVRVTYTKELKSITSKDEAVINAIQEILLNEISINALGDSKMNLNVNSKSFTFQADNNSETELNLKSENATFSLSEKAKLKALIATTDFRCDLYQKSEATLEGNATNVLIRLDSNSEFAASKFVTTNATVTAEGYSNCSVNVTSGIVIEASGNSEIDLYGEPKIEMKRFVENASLNKKPTK